MSLVGLLIVASVEIPRAMSEVAMTDGCTRLQAFWHIELPLSKSGIASAGIFAFLISCLIYSRYIQPTEARIISSRSAEKTTWYQVMPDRRIPYKKYKNILLHSILRSQQFSFLHFTPTFCYFLRRGRPGKLGSASASFGRAKIKIAKQQKSPKQKTF